MSAVSLALVICQAVVIALVFTLSWPVQAKESGIKLSLKTTQIGGFIDLYLQNGQGKIVGVPDWVIVLLPGPKRVVYSLSSMRYHIGVDENSAWDRMTPAKVRWSNWKLLGEGATLNRVRVTKWERKGTGLWKYALRNGVREEVWATTDFAIDPYLRKSFCGICKIDPPKGIPLKLVRTTASMDGSREVEMDLNLHAVQDVTLKQSDLELPKNLTAAPDVWSVVSGGGVHDSLFLGGEPKKQ